MKKGQPNQAGTVSALSVFTQPRYLNRMNVGISVTCCGIIIVESMSAKQTPRKRERMREKAKAARLQDTRLPTTLLVTMMSVFFR